MTQICIVAARRTPHGRFLGSLTKRSAVDLALCAAKPVLEGVAPETVDEVVLGNVVGAGQGMNIARQVAVNLGLPVRTPAYTVNMMCASGMQAVALAAQSIQSGRARVVLCGGTESMSRAPYLLDRARLGYKLGDNTLIDGLLRDGLVDTFSNDHMGLLTDRLAAKYELTRQMQDACAAESHRRYFAAFDGGLYDNEYVAMEELDHDEHARRDSTADILATLKPAFNREGTITAGNASGINDGAAMLLLCDADTAAERKWEPLAVIEDWAAVGCDPAFMGLGPVEATRQLCRQLDCALADFDAIELNEAFAAQTLACLRDLELEGDARVNPEGGAIAIGHPIGATGARLIVHLTHKIAADRSKRALATLCVGGGMGHAMALRAG